MTDRENKIKEDEATPELLEAPLNPADQRIASISAERAGQVFPTASEKQNVVDSKHARLTARRLAFCLGLSVLFFLLSWMSFDWCVNSNGLRWSGEWENHMFAGALFILPIYMMREIFKGPERTRTKLILSAPLWIGLLVSIVGIFLSLGSLMFPPELKLVTAARNGTLSKTYYHRGIFSSSQDLLQTIEYRTIIPNRLYWIRQTYNGTGIVNHKPREVK